MGRIVQRREYHEEQWMVYHSNPGGAEGGIWDHIVAVAPSASEPVRVRGDAAVINCNLDIMFRVNNTLAMMVWIFFLVACASNGFLMAKPKVTMLGEKYPPRAKESSIDVYVTGKPTSAYIELAQITCRDTNNDWSLNQIKIKAREIGADGIIIIGKAGSSGLGVPMGSSTYVVSQEYGMTAIAIKYK